MSIAESLPCRMCVGMLCDRMWTCWPRCGHVPATGNKCCHTNDPLLYEQNPYRHCLCPMEYMRNVQQCNNVHVAAPLLVLTADSNCTSSEVCSYTSTSV